MLPKNFALFLPESDNDCDENLSTVGAFCRILVLVGEAESGNGGDQPAEE
jgi:hypothetical protein